MNIKKLNEELEKFLSMNEISDELNQKVIDNSEKIKQEVFNKLQEIAIKAFEDFGYKIKKINYNEEDDYHVFLTAQAVDDTLEIYINHSDLESLEDSENIKNIAVEGFECDATITCSMYGFTDSWVTLNTKDEEDSFSNIESSLDGLIDEAHVDEEDQDEYGDVDLSPAK